VSRFLPQQRLRKSVYFQILSLIEDCGVNEQDRINFKESFGKSSTKGDKLLKCLSGLLE